MVMFRHLVNSSKEYHSFLKEMNSNTNKIHQGNHQMKNISEEDLSYEFLITPLKLGRQFWYSEILAISENRIAIIGNYNNPGLGYIDIDIKKIVYRNNGPEYKSNFSKLTYMKYHNLYLTTRNSKDVVAFNHEMEYQGLVIDSN